MNNPYNIIIIISSILLILSYFAFSKSSNGQDDGYFGVLPDDYYDPHEYGMKSSIPGELHNDASKQIEPPIDSEGINFIAAGDWVCNKETAKTIKNIVNFKPELVVGLGDYLYQNPSADCWFNLSKPIDDLMRIAIGNHDLDFKSSYQQLIDHYGLKKPYYSFNFGNIHFVTISTLHPFEKGSVQYEFIEEDLEKTSTDPNILWKIVFLHKPFYSASDFDKNASEDLRKTFQRMFEHYNVDIVLSGHTHYYQRTLPISYNEDSDLYPIVVKHENYEYNKNNGIMFVTAGTAGDDSHSIDYFLPFAALQKNTHGFLNFDIKDNGDTLVGTFYDNKNLEIIDQFTISKKIGKYFNARM